MRSLLSSNLRVLMGILFLLLSFIGKASAEVASSDLSPEEEAKAAAFRNFMETVDSIYFANKYDKDDNEDEDDEDEDEEDEKLTRVEMEYLVLSALLERVGMDNKVIGERPLKSNWLEQLHVRALKLAPSPAFWKVYPRPPNQTEFASIVNLDVYAQAQSNTIEDLRRFAFSPHRDRGMVASLSVSFSSMVLQPIQHFAGYSTPTNQLLERLANDYPKIVEVGAGNGYWSAALELNGANVIAYDSTPPTLLEDETNPNLFSHVAEPFTTVHKATCTEIFNDATQKEELGQRALLMIWPNNPDHIDNPTHHSSAGGGAETEKLPIWDVDCLQSYLAAGGSTVIYVGEREENILIRRDNPPDVGMSSSKRFQTMLKDKFTLVETFDIPGWWGAEDVTVWQIKTTDEL